MKKRIILSLFIVTSFCLLGGLLLKIKVNAFEAVPSAGSVGKGEILNIELFAKPQTGEMAVELNAIAIGMTIANFIPSTDWMVSQGTCENDLSFTATTLCYILGNNFEITPNKSLGLLTVEMGNPGTATLLLNNTIYGTSSNERKVSGEIANFTITEAPSQPVTVWRFFNALKGGHLYTINEGEKNDVLKLTSEWNYEGEKFKVYQSQAPGTVPVYRFWNKTLGTHLYTINENEKNTVIQTLPNYVYEGIKYYVYPESAEGTIPVYRFFNNVIGTHLYTIDQNEKTTIQTTLSQFNYEGIKFYVKGL